MCAQGPVNYFRSRAWNLGLTTNTLFDQSHLQRYVGVETSRGPQILPRGVVLLCTCLLAVCCLARASLTPILQPSMASCLTGLAVAHGIRSQDFMCDRTVPLDRTAYTANTLFTSKFNT